MDITIFHNHSMMCSLANELGFLAHKHKYKRHRHLAVEVIDALVPHGILLCESSFFSSTSFVCLKKSWLNVFQVAALLLRPIVGEATNIILLRKRVLGFVFFFFYYSFTEMTFLCLSSCSLPVSLLSVLCFRVIWSVYYVATVFSSVTL